MPTYTLQIVLPEALKVRTIYFGARDFAHATELANEAGVRVLSLTEAGWKPSFWRSPTRMVAHACLAALIFTIVARGSATHQEPIDGHTWILIIAMMSIMGFGIWQSRRRWKEHVRPTSDITSLKPLLAASDPFRTTLWNDWPMWFAPVFATFQACQVLGHASREQLDDIDQLALAVVFIAVLLTLPNNRLASPWPKDLEDPPQA